MAASSEFVKKSDLDALIKALKESGNIAQSISFHASCSNVNLIDSTSKPLIVDSGASHHMISDSNLISNIKPALGHVNIANGEMVKIEGIGNLKLFDKESSVFYMPTFKPNLLSTRKVTSDLNCYAKFGANDFWFQDIKTNRCLGQGTTKGNLYVLEDTQPSSLSC